MRRRCFPLTFSRNPFTMNRFRWYLPTRQPHWINLYTDKHTCLHRYKSLSYNIITFKLPHIRSSEKKVHLLLVLRFLYIRTSFRCHKIALAFQSIGLCTAPLMSHHSMSVRLGSGSFQHLGSFVFQTFCCKFVSVLCIIVLLMIQFQPSFSSRLKNTLIYRGVHGGLNGSKVSRSCGCKTSLHHQPVWGVCADMLCFK